MKLRAGHAAAALLVLLAAALAACSQAPVPGSAVVDGGDGGEDDGSDGGSGGPDDDDDDGGGTGTPAAEGPIGTQVVRFDASDGAQLHAIIRGVQPLAARPLIVEFSPYGGNGIPDFGPGYNHVFVHARGTGESTGVWSAVGPRDQADVSEFLAWACSQPWSNGHIGLYGFSASAIAVYNSQHLPLACVDAAALGAGTHELYRDLLVPGGILMVGHSESFPAAHPGFRSCGRTAYQRVAG